MAGPTDRARTGWLFVAAQVVLLVALVALPTGTAWPMPGWLRGVALGLVVLGLVGIAAASLTLGRALTPTPVPNGRGALRTGGLYRFVRHPIYTGVLAAVLGVTLGSRQWLGLALGIATVTFFGVKARWEEARLAEAFPGYADYAAVTPRFVPFWPRALIRPLR
ncbi:isoprenylcysteine carboxylmethyltransferase family protein [Nocardioides sp.]|uniref:methyltransferase family protein n=1 Tax=Nocardioides sp. TaxID=35761 RepID=UPI003529ACD7